MGREQDIYSNCVQVFVDVLGNGVDFRIQFFFHQKQVLLVILRNEVNRQTQVPKPPTPSNPMQVRVTKLWEIKIYDHIHSLNVNPPSEQIGTYQAPCFPLLKIMVNSIPFLLLHP